MSTTARGGIRALALALALVTVCWPAGAHASESLDHHRNRLLDTLAQRHGFTDRCAFWRTLDDSERGVFLTHTDLLGNRSCSGTQATCAPGDEQALDHVVRLWALLGTDPGCHGCNGGMDWHRTFWQADTALLLRWRDLTHPLPAWRISHDLLGPHRPFDWTLETLLGPPRGQIQLFSSAAAAVPLQRAGVERLIDPDVFELDEDYNWRHDSNPEGRYGRESGRALHMQVWSRMGNGIPTAFVPEWFPRCGEFSIRRVEALHERIILRGSFASQGNRLLWRDRNGSRSWEGAALEQSDTQLSVSFASPHGPGFFYVEERGVLSPLQAYPTPP